MKRIFLGLAGLAMLAGCRTGGTRAVEAAVVVYGGTSAGVAAAVQAARMGTSVVLVGPDRHLGGCRPAGLGYTDSGNTKAVGGLAREFYGRVYARYDDDGAWRWQKMAEFKNEGQGSRSRVEAEKTQWTFEPHVAEAVFDAWAAERKVPVYRNEWLDRAKGVVKQGGRIASITMLSGRTFRAKVFIDATYEGDLMAAAACPTTSGARPTASTARRGTASSSKRISTTGTTS
jgi:glycine/D-amino acid oxidase-like deaminating enzyme